MFLMYGLPIAIPVVIVYRIPVYLLLRYLRLVNMYTVISLGALPGISAYIWAPDSLSPFVLSAGIVTAVISHRIAVRAAPNKPMEPTR
jgi:hypothetical protein